MLRCVADPLVEQIDERILLIDERRLLALDRGEQLIDSTVFPLEYLGDDARKGSEVGHAERLGILLGERSTANLVDDLVHVVEVLTKDLRPGLFDLTLERTKAC